jgi:hypothetical protein
MDLKRRWISARIFIKAKKKLNYLLAARFRLG